MTGPNPLYKPGFHPSSMEELKKVCVFQCYNPKRDYLFGRLEVYLEQLEKVGATFEIWIDGSFITNKTSPGDIDLIIWYDSANLKTINTDQKQLLDTLVADTNLIKSRYSLHVFIRPKEDIDQNFYWKGCFCFVKETDEPKGVPTLRINHDEPNSMA